VYFVPSSVASEIGGNVSANTLFNALYSELHALANLKFFCGFTFAEIATMQRLSERTVQRRWEKARIYLHCCMFRDEWTRSLV
jgi:DNA-directed RNA polymerase specialized sigma24 family protein